MTMHLGDRGVASCGESHLLAHNTTNDVLQCDCLKCITSVLGVLLHQADLVANRLRIVAEQMRRPAVLEVSS